MSGDGGDVVKEKIELREPLLKFGGVCVRRELFSSGRRQLHCAL